ncbi:MULTISPECIES: NirD/YgiW/YdeI family stress tolerance protein [Pseudomonas]|uniref:NirD/YgiW/YdeI family stress tolerance protein n=1 Tax=Pseudomonas quercus TaxID=2722792 RepID=A0ABX0YBB2_9PSED|nr:MULTISPECIES: NirD/YgiW/YdeI family stress tolerance protein [Pseudomonas]MBF7142105.1 NirD/YgiW/YdeI family stress tolerance protein [Pseudomonas sp. LY10J]NJP00643.1 NirD/YgiW/YdeI family stress tolerance protein [Pseudomonas quercus]
MKLRYLSICVLPLLGMAGYSQAAGYTGPGGQAANTGATAAAAVDTAKAATAAPDDTPAVLEGHIVKKLAIQGRDNRYEFKDATGTIQLDIDNDKWPSDVTDQQRVRVIGEVDMDNGKQEVDVDVIQVLK